MSPRRKSGLSPEDLQALKHLPAVLTALEHLQEQHAKVRALMGIGGHGVGMDFRAGHPTAEHLSPAAKEEAETIATRMFWEWRDAQGRSQSVPVDGRQIPSAEANIRVRESPANPILDTPERREYEAAKKSGKTVPVVDPFANASPAQRERMAEQRAVIDAERAARGLPARGEARPGSGPSITELRARADVLLHGTDEEVAALRVRTEALDTLSDGTTPLADDADEEVH